MNLTSTKVLKIQKKSEYPWFRKGHTPIGLIKKQYGMSVKVEEINKLMERVIRLFEHWKIGNLGNPIPVENEIDLNSDVLAFDFEFGSRIDVNLKNKM